MTAKKEQEKIPSFEEWFFAQNPTDEEKVAYFIEKQKAKEEEEARNSEFRLWDEMTKNLQSMKNKKVKDLIDSSMFSASIGGDWTTIRRDD